MAKKPSKLKSLKAGRPKGRPSKYNEEVVDIILQNVLEGKTLNYIADNVHGVPVLSTMLLWLSKHESFFKEYYQARSLVAELDISEIKTIADSTTNETINIDKLRIEARKFNASKLLHKIYGDKRQVEDNSNTKQLDSSGITEVIEMIRDKLIVVQPKADVKLIANS